MALYQQVLLNETPSQPLRKSPALILNRQYPPHGWSDHHDCVHDLDYQVFQWRNYLILQHYNHQQVNARRGGCQ